LMVPRRSPTLAASAIQPDRPRFDGVGPKMRLRPRVLGEPGPEFGLRLGLDDEYDAVLVGERSAEHDEAFVGEPIHERRMSRPVGLPFERPRRVPFRTGSALQDMEGRHGRPRYPVAE
jgi:hypothetical protein